MYPVRGLSSCGICIPPTLPFPHPAPHSEPPSQPQPRALKGDCVQAQVQALARLVLNQARHLKCPFLTSYRPHLTNSCLVLSPSSGHPRTPPAALQLAGGRRLQGCPAVCGGRVLGPGDRWGLVHEAAHQEGQDHTSCPTLPRASPSLAPRGPLWVNMEATDPGPQRGHTLLLPEPPVLCPAGRDLGLRTGPPGSSRGWDVPFSTLFLPQSLPAPGASKAATDHSTSPPGYVLRKREDWSQRALTPHGKAAKAGHLGLQEGSGTASIPHSILEQVDTRTIGTEAQWAETQSCPQPGALLVLAPQPGMALIKEDQAAVDKVWNQAGPRPCETPREVISECPSPWPTPE